MTPIHRKRIFAIIGVGLCIYLAAGRCNDEILIAQDEGRFYHSLAITIEKFISKVAPIPSVFPASKRSNAATLTNAGACIALHSTVLVTMGYLLPLTYLLINEMLSRTEFEFDVTQRITFLPRPSNLLIVHMAVVPFEAILSFQFAVFVLNLVEFARLSGVT